MDSGGTNSMRFRQSEMDAARAVDTMHLNLRRSRIVQREEVLVLSRCDNGARIRGWSGCSRSAGCEQMRGGRGCWRRLSGKMHCAEKKCSNKEDENRETNDGERAGPVCGVIFSADDALERGGQPLHGDEEEPAKRGSHRFA